MKNWSSAKGFSMIEASIALTIGAIFLGSVVSTWYASSKVWNQERVRHEMRLNIEKAMERLKSDLRLTTADGILYYPSTASTKTAISIPRATPNSSTGLLSMSGGSIAWDKTIVYHLYTSGSTTQFCRTVFSYNSNTSTRQAQLDGIAVAGTYSGGATTTLFTVGSASFEITPESPTFDGYLSTGTGRSGKTNFGSLRLSSGTHTIRFRVTGKNTAAPAGAYGIGIDSIMLSPSGGGQQEAEALSFTGSGASPSVEDLTSAFGGSQHVKFPGSAVNQYVEFTVPYDQWLESNFANATHDTTTVTTGADPHVTIMSRETQSLTPAWQAGAQTDAASTGSDGTAGGMTVRSVISGPYITRSGTMMRLKFQAGSNDLRIQKAYFGVRDTSPSDTPNFTSAPTTLYFDNPILPPGSTDDVGSTDFPGAVTDVTITAGNYTWTNWFSVSPSSSNDYLVSMYVASGAGATWTGAVTPQSYRVTGDVANSTDDLSVMAGYSFNADVFCVAEMATWQNSGTITSQIFDTKVTSPSFSQMSWTPTLNGGTIALKMRSSADSTMTGATDWSLLASSLNSPTLLAAGSRYVQFQATLTAASPYTALPELDDVTIAWPGNTALVEVSGYYTKKPTYGTFEVLVDGEELIKGVVVKLTASDTLQGQSFAFSQTIEQEALNTGK